MYNTLTEPLITVDLMNGGRETATLPGVLAWLCGDRVAAFPALRPHQSQAWHAFLVQLAALALHRAGDSEPPPDEPGWMRRLRALTADWPDDEPWSLIAPADKPALLQAPVAGGSLADFKSGITTPDALDMLITSKNHDLKAAMMDNAAPEDWLFALLTLQTMEGFLGAGNYGISRMNGGFANRPCVSILPPGGPGARLRRDLAVLLRRRPDILNQIGQFPVDGGLGLVWLRPWDGREQIGLADLDPFYIEICRRVRLVGADRRINALASGSNKARIAAAEAKGVTGDPWMPINIAEAKALSVSRRGFNYRVMTELILGEKYHPALLQEIDRDDPEKGLAIHACGVARGQGKTEGFHERTVLISKTIAAGFRRRQTDTLARLANDRVQNAGNVRGKILRPALFSLLQDGPDKINYGSKTTGPQSERWLKAFERRIDDSFFERLWEEAEAKPEERDAIHNAWLQDLRDWALEQLERAEGAVPLASMRRYRARTRGRRLFNYLFYKEFPDLRSKESEHDIV